MSRDEVVDGDEMNDDADEREELMDHAAEREAEDRADAADAALHREGWEQTDRMYDEASESERNVMDGITGTKRVIPLAENRRAELFENRYTKTLHVFNGASVMELIYFEPGSMSDEELAERIEGMVPFA